MMMTTPATSEPSPPLLHKATNQHHQYSQTWTVAVAILSCGTDAGVSLSDMVGRQISSKKYGNIIATSDEAYFPSVVKRRANTMSAQSVCGFDGFVYIFEVPVTLPGQLSLIKVASVPPHLLRGALFNDAALWRTLLTGESPLSTKRVSVISIDAWETVQANLEALLLRFASDLVIDRLSILAAHHYLRLSVWLNASVAYLRMLRVSPISLQHRCQKRRLPT
jgi:hypothetical protein